MLAEVQLMCWGGGVTKKVQLFGEVFLFPSTSTSLNTDSVVCAFTEEEKPKQVHSSATTQEHDTAELKRHSTQYVIFFFSRPENC